MEQVRQIGWDSALTALGAMGVAFVAMKVSRERVGIPMSMNGALMFALAVFLGNLPINYLQKAKYIQADLQ